MTERGSTSIQQPPMDLESIPGQIGTAIIRTNPISRTNNDNAHEPPMCTGEMTPKDADIMYSILSEIGAILSPLNVSATMGSVVQGNKAGGVEKDDAIVQVKEEESLKKFTVSFPSIQYTCCVSNAGCIYIVKKRSA